MNDVTGRPPLLRPRTAAVVAIGAVAVSLTSIGLLHVMAAGRTNPVSETVSSYVHVDGGAELLAVATLALAFGFAAAAYGLVSAGVRVDRSTRTLALAWGAALVLVALFPADKVGAPKTIPGIVHTAASGSVFLCLPLAGWRLTGVLTGEWLPVVRAVRILVCCAGLAALAFAITHPPITEWYGGTAMHGLAERVLLALQVGIVLVIAHRLWRIATAPRVSESATRAEVVR